MHSSLQSLAHRAPPATRTKVRWQPYVSFATCTAPRTPPSTYLSTPSSSISSSPPLSTPSSSFTHDHPRSTASISAQSQKDSKTRYATSLVDQAVGSLNDLWHPQDIPLIFLAASAPGGNELIASPTTSQILKLCTKNTQLPSPVSPNTLPSPPTLPSTATCIESATAMFGPQNALVPLRGFVHEVLRRSRTSGSILQTALCYLEACRPQIKQLMESHKLGDPDPPVEDKPSFSRIEMATEAEIQMDLALEGMDLDSFVDVQVCSEVMDTVRIYDNDIVDDIICDSRETAINPPPKAPTAPLDPLPPLPSPLLCPRRALLAALILASKFANDKCYSNRAWAKLSGLPPREIGRCERALGEALDWRLWVGKSSTGADSMAPVVPQDRVVGQRPISRCRSESNLQKVEPFFATRDDAPVSQVKSGIRRCKTVPATGFALNSESNPKLPESASLGIEMNMTASLFLNNSWDYTDGPPTEKIDANPTASFGSPCSDTPSLSYSPSSSTDSSYGDQTVLMPTFSDDAMGQLSCFPDAIGLDIDKHMPQFGSYESDKRTFALLPRIIDPSQPEYGAYQEDPRQWRAPFAIAL